MKNKQLKTGIFLGSIGLLIIAAILYNIWKVKQLKQDGVVLKGTITSIVLITRGSPLYRYEFSYKGKKFKKENSTGVMKLNCFIGKSFPVIFSPKTENSELLIAPSDFSRFDISFPDSLSWVTKFENN